MPVQHSTEPAAAEPNAADRKERIIRSVFLFVMPFLMVTMMFATYVATMHSPHPRQMPVAVVGSGAEAQAIVDALNATPGEPAAARLVASRDAALDLLRDQEISGALQPPAAGSDQATIFTATAAGASRAATAQQLLAPVAVQQEWTSTTEEIAALPENDRAGIAVLFAAMGMMLAGYVPLSLLLMATPHLLRLRRFVPLVAGWSALTSTVIWLILGPVVGAVDGHYLTFLGVGMLATGAVGLAQLLFTKLMGPMAVLLGMLLYVVFGMPASNLALPIDTMPGFFQFLHGVLPLPAAGEALRSALYFDGRGLVGHLLTLAAWIVVAVLLCLLKERGGAAIPQAPQVDGPDTPLPALAGGPLRSKRFRYVTVAAFPLSIMVVVVGLMSFSMHKPEPHDIPVAVVAAVPEQAERAAAGLRAGLEGVADISVAASVDEAREQILAQDLVAAYVLPSAPGGEATLYSSSAAGSSQHMMVQTMFQQIAAGQQTPLALTDVAPLSKTDTMGSNSLYVGMSWIMSGFLMLAVLRGGAPHLRRLRQFLPILGGWAIGMSVWLWLLFDVIIGAVNGHALEMIGFGAFTIFAVSLVTGVFTRTFGLAAIIPVMVVLMMAGVPASGGGLSVYMVPEFFRTLQGVLPLPAAVDTARSLVYFDGVGVGRNLAVVAVWAVVGLLLNLGVDRWLRRRERAAGGTWPQPASGTPGGMNGIGELEPVRAS
ncbi:ABC transporter permease [Micromonospora peucetia]|uniref:ABC transporter permease n=1 Tax=Micromonospora peucetia TaxID=47871 RepID=UPI0022547C56|nr:ABC transporter permease [Micromonospora peucetia]MCX4389825.1 ABC transporter permease [Micromonospora peucetia]